MKRLCMSAVLLVSAAFVGCDQALAPEDETDGRTGVHDSRGGVPGPPPWVLINIPAVPPPHAPGKRPPHAGPPGFLTDVIDVGAGGQYSCALRSDGTAYCWGANHRGQLGDGTQAPSAVPVEVAGRLQFEQLVVGDLNACGILATGEAYCWGDNSIGQLGDGSTAPLSREPVPVAGGHRFDQISIGLRTTCGVADDGMTYCWGNNQFGQLGIGTVGGSSNVPVPVMNSGTLGFTQVSVGFWAVCGRAATSVYCWGDSRRFGNGPSTGLTGVPTPAAGGASFSTVEVGAQYVCGLDVSGAASCWGVQSSGELGSGSQTATSFTPTAVSGGLHFASLDANNNNSALGMTCGVTAANDAWCWGSNQYGQLGGTSSETCTFSGVMYGCSSTPIGVSGGLSFNDIAVGLTHTCAVTPGGSAYCWGDNRSGQLGDGTTDPQAAPVQVVGLDEDVSVASIMITPYLPRLILLGSTVQFTAVVLDYNGVPLSPQPALTWSSSDPAIATVDNTGLATAVATGDATIMATSADGIVGRAAIEIRLIDPVRTFTQAYVGDGSRDGFIMLGGLLADEWTHTGTFPTRLEVDQRTINPGNLSVAGTFDHLLLARTALEFEANRLQSVDPNNARIGQMLTLAGFTYVALAESFCSGVPLDDPDVGVSTAELFAMAQSRFAEALLSPIDVAHTYAAHVGAARAALGVGDFNTAAANAALVPLGFALNTTHSNASGELNGIAAVTTLTPRFSQAHVEGVNGLPFRSLDQRAPWTASGIGQDFISPFFLQLTYPSVASPMPLATSIEALLILAETALPANPGAFISYLNQARSLRGLAPLADPGSPAARIDLLFHERGYLLFATGHRLGDLRRLMASYGGSAASLFPVGAHPRFPFAYGADVNLPVPLSARGSGYSGCPRTM